MTRAPHFFINVWVALFLTVAFSATGAPLANSRSFVNELGMFTWVRGGRIEYFTTESVGLRYGVAYYQKTGQRRILLTDDCWGISYLVRSEMPADKIDEAFLKKELIPLLVDTSPTPGGIVIDEEFKAGYSEFVGSKQEKSDSGVTHEQAEKIGAMVNALDDPKIAMQGDSWRIVFNLCTRFGSVEEWSFEGKMRPFSVESTSRKQVYQEGSVFVLGVSFE